ncbi:hypothetical protein [Quatrionicoccus australiensis]|uniref:hypothetical protein n=1 Tax=Quatrionicoccus australiensis TaxID=138118 RepID=UPI001CFA3B88|nr:hypothetical protein [Quatrionicoccus australiensis]MCB4359592.1 hypothetical protein [Quatrionicoccus australiensis]
MPALNWTATPEAQAAAREKKAANVGAAKEGAARERHVVERLKKRINVPCVIFTQGYAADDETERKGELPTDAGYEPSIADYRIERVHKDVPARVHVEVTGSSSKYMKVGMHFWIRIEKLKQSQRTGDTKYYALHYDNFGFGNGRVEPWTAYFHVPADAFDLSGTVADIEARYNDRRGVHVRWSNQQAFLALPYDTEYRITETQVVADIERILNKAWFDAKLDAETQAADAAWHALLQADAAKLEALNLDFMARRMKLTWRDNAVQTLNAAEQKTLQAIGSLNTPDLLKSYVAAINA